jgi:hypothetical protein
MMSTSLQAGCQEAILSRNRRIIKARGRGIFFKTLGQRGKPQRRETPWICSNCRYRLARAIIEG